MRFPRFRLFAALMLCLPLAACLSTTKWEPVPEPVSPRDYIEQQRPDRVQVLLTTGEAPELRYPLLRGDSIVGLGLTGGPVSLALRDVSGLNEARFRPHAVVGNIGLGLLYLMAAVGVLCSMGDCALNAS